jgi:hypothetical protein
MELVVRDYSLPSNVTRYLEPLQAFFCSRQQRNDLSYPETHNV